VEVQYLSSSEMSCDANEEYVKRIRKSNDESPWVVDRRCCLSNFLQVYEKLIAGPKHVQE
jgi:hypothetical protein